MPDLFDARAVADLRTDLRLAGYTVDRLRELWGDEAERALSRGNRAPARRAIERSDPGAGQSALSALARLFLLGETLTDAEVASALPSTGAAGAETLGLILRAAGVARAALDLRPYSFTDLRGTAEWWILSDLGELALGHELPVEHVLGVGGASTTLSALMMQDPVESALDLGTGCGIQAMHASRFADRVVATDVSERALRIATLNVQLNDVSGVEFRHGSLFEPVRGERFDRIFSNPPFVITPRAADVPGYEYRDGGLEGDEIVRLIVGECREHLTVGGIAQLLGNWEYRGSGASRNGAAGGGGTSGDDAAGGGTGGDGLARVRSWVDDGGPLDAWVIERDLQAPAEYAETWIRDGGVRPGSPDFERLCARWLEDFDARNVHAVGFGYIVLRRAPDDGDVPLLRRFEHVDGGYDRSSSLGMHLAACLRARDAEAALSDADFAFARLVCASDVTEERHSWPGEETPVRILLRQGAGFGRVVDADAALAGFVGACDGELTVGVIADALAELLEVPADALRADLLPRVRDLIGEGFLTFA